MSSLSCSWNLSCYNFSLFQENFTIYFQLSSLYIFEPGHTCMGTIIRPARTRYTPIFRSGRLLDGCQSRSIVPSNRTFGSAIKSAPVSHSKHTTKNLLSFPLRFLKKKNLFKRFCLKEVQEIQQSLRYRIVV